MRKIALILSVFLLYASSAFCDIVQVFKDYNTGDNVTADNLDGNLNNIRNVINGGLDNTNADTTDGFRFVEILDALPSPGQQGRVVFFTVDNQLYFDTGSQFVQAVTLLGTLELGDTIYHDGTTFVDLDKSTDSTRYLSNRGTDNIPSWSKVQLSDGADIQGMLQGDIFFASSPTVIARLPKGTSEQILRMNTAATAPEWTNISGSVEVFTTSGTWTAPAGVNYITVSMCGGGGGGAAGNTSGSNGGGGGEAGESIINHILKVTPTSTYSVTIGAAGTAGTSNGDGGDGGDTSFVGDNYTLTALGGDGGSSSGGAGGAGEADGNTNLNGADTSGNSGGNAGTIYRFAGGDGGSQTTNGDGGGGGGSSMLGEGGDGGSDPTPNAQDGQGSCGGGGGGQVTNGGTVSRNGGAGYDGIVIIKYNINGTPS